MGSVCGKLCAKTASGAKSSVVESENELPLPSYKSDADNDFKLIENKFNFLRDLRFNDFFHALVNFSDQTATLEENYLNMTYEHSANDPFYETSFSIYEFQSFLENKILKHESLYEKAGNDERATSIFKEILFGAYDGLATRLAKEAKEKDGNTTLDKTNVIKKKHVISFGILYCFSNIAKVHMIFNLFKSGEVIGYSEKFSDFLLSLFILGSYGLANARYKTSKYEEVGSIDQNNLREYLQIFELKDSQNLVNITNKKIFGENLTDQLSYENFKAKFNKSDDSIGYILNASGIRDMQKLNNV